jgi:translocation and assembly module TamB
VDRLLLGDQRISGRFSALATVRGAMNDPRVAGTFALTQGAFQTFMFDSLHGTIDYAERSVELDVRLDQGFTWLMAIGKAPLTLFRPTPPEIAGAHEEPAPGEEVNIEVYTSAIDLGLIQGFTSYVTDVTGTLQANVKVSGSGNDPHINGAVDIRGGAFAVPDLGTSYTGLDTRVDLQNEQVAIREFKILDNRGFPMTVGGTLAMHARELGAVNINIQSENFEIIDNELADLKLDTDLRITGEVRKPRVEGTIEVENGTIHVAALVERTTSNPYSTDAADLSALGADEAARETAAANAAEAAPAEAAPEPSVFDALEMNVTLHVPSNLVLRGNDIRPANAPIEIGDMNATVGGDLQIRKEPAEAVRLTGEVNTVRGSYTFQGRRFDILRDGRIRFAGTDDIDPLLDIRAQRVISGVTAVVRVQGTMREPELSFSSNPPLDQADILSLIVFNQPINQLGEGQQVSLAQRAGALAGGYLTSGLSRSIGNALELDEFEIQAQGEGGGPSLSVGEQVGEKLFFRVRQGFGDAQATELILEYQIADFLRLQGTAAETAGGVPRVTFRRVERGGIDLIFFFSY